MRTMSTCTRFNTAVQGHMQGVSRGGYRKLNLGGPGSFCRGGCRIGDSRAQTALEIFSHRANHTCRFHVLV